jgi:flagellar protein FliO/FliZ
MSAYTSYLLETFVTLLAVCAVAVVVLYGARRMGMGRSSGGIELVGRLPLDARRSIVLVRVGAQVFLVGVADGGFTKLGELAASDVPSPPPSETGSGTGGFAATLSRVLGRGRAVPEAKDTEGT